MRPPRAWPRTVQAALLWGGAAVFLSLVGLVEALQQRQIVSGVISGGHSLLLLMALAAGATSARYHAGSGAARRVAAAGLAGAIVGAVHGLALVRLTRAATNS